MQDLFAWGEIFFSNLMVFGDWLLHKPLAAADELFLWFADFLEFYQFKIGPIEIGPSDTVIAFFEMLGSQSVASLILGSSLVIVLGVKLIKFLLGAINLLS